MVRLFLVRLLFSNNKKRKLYKANLFINDEQYVVRLIGLREQLYQTTKEGKHQIDANSDLISFNPLKPSYIAKIMDYGVNEYQKKQKNNAKQSAVTVKCVCLSLQWLSKISIQTSQCSQPRKK